MVDFHIFKKYEKVLNLDIKGMWKVAKINENKGKY